MPFTGAAIEPFSAHSQAGMRDLHIMMTESDSFDEHEVVSSLRDDSFNRRSEILDQLRNSVRISQCLPFRNSIGLFQALNLALSDTNWGVRRQCLLLISEYIPLLRLDVDACMGIILPQLIYNIGDNKVVIRKDAIQTLHLYMKHTSDMPSLMNKYVQYGLDSQHSNVRKETIVSLPMLVTSDFASEDFTEIVVSLCKKLVDRHEDESLQRHSVIILNKMRSILGDRKFKSYLMKLAAPLREYYCKIANFHLEDPQTERRSTSTDHTADGKSSSNDSAVNLHFGIIPPVIMAQLSNQDNFRSRNQAVEELKRIIGSLPNLSPLGPHVDPFISLLNSLLDDNNFKIITVTLDILALLVERMAQNIRPHLKPIILTLTKRMGDNKNVIRQAITKVIMQLMQTLRPKLVLLLLNDNLMHRSPRVRTETINCIIAALHTFPSYEFDLDSLCSSVSDCLLDSKRSVRHACLECISVIAQCLGAGKLHPLLYAVECLEQNYGSESEGVKAAVQARLTRRSLPKINEDNLVGKPRLYRHTIKHFVYLKHT